MHRSEMNFDFFSYFYFIILDKLNLHSDGSYNYHILCILY
jgi:hypothetical protein